MSLYVVASFGFMICPTRIGQMTAKICLTKTFWRGGFLVFFLERLFWVKDACDVCESTAIADQDFYSVPVPHLSAEQMAEVTLKGKGWG
jgi:hypothetical protein